MSPLRSSLCWQCCFFIAQHGSLEGLAHIGMSSQAAAGVQHPGPVLLLNGWATHIPATKHVPDRADLGHLYNAAPWVHFIPEASVWKTQVCSKNLPAAIAKEAGSRRWTLYPLKVGLSLLVGDFQRFVDTSWRLHPWQPWYCVSLERGCSWHGLRAVVLTLLMEYKQTCQPNKAQTTDQRFYRYWECKEPNIFTQLIAGVWMGKRLP